jgi:hypothetical protein
MLKKYIFTLFLLIPSLLGLGGASIAWANSGIRCVNDCSYGMSPSSNPPAYQDRVTTFDFQIKNTNNVCNEDLKIADVVLLNDPWATRDGLIASGYSSFLGFKESAGGGTFSSLDFELKDGNSKTIYVDVKTGEDSNGCDFKAFKLNVLVCDTGAHGFFKCDNFDRDKPCESPTPLTPLWTLEAAPTPPDPGTGQVSGIVLRDIGGGLHARMRLLRIGTCVANSPDGAGGIINLEDSTEAFGVNQGKYSFSNLPYGQYSLTAIVIGVTDDHTETKNFTIDSSTSAVVLDYAFTL